MAIRAALEAAAASSASACWCRNRRTAPTRRPRPPAASPSMRSRPTTRGRVDLEALQGEARPRRRRDHADQPQHLRPVRARHHRDRRRGARGRRLLLLRRRQLQRHRRAGAAGRSRHRRHAHQPAQDLLDAAWRRRPGLPARWCCRRRWRPSRRCRTSCTARTASTWSSTQKATQAVRPAQGLPRPDGHVRARARLHDEPRRRRPAPGRRGRGAQRQLHHGAPART